MKTSCSTSLVCLNRSTEAEKEGRTVFCVCGDEAPQVAGPVSSCPNIMMFTSILPLILVSIAQGGTSYLTEQYKDTKQTCCHCVIGMM